MRPSPMTNTQTLTERERLTIWSAQNPRDRLAMVAICAWLNVREDQLPPEWHGHTCPATKEAWSRVAEAIKAEVLKA